LAESDIEVLVSRLKSGLPIVDIGGGYWWVFFDILEGLQLGRWCNHQEEWD
jgi:hypothetical protein